MMRGMGRGEMGRPDSLVCVPARAKTARLYLTDDRGEETAFEVAGEHLLPEARVFVSARASPLPGLRFWLYASRDVHAMPVVAGQAASEPAHIPERVAAVVVVAGQFPPSDDEKVRKRRKTSPATGLPGVVSNAARGSSRQ